MIDRVVACRNHHSAVGIQRPDGGFGKWRGDDSEVHQAHLVPVFAAPDRKPPAIASAIAAPVGLGSRPKKKHDLTLVAAGQHARCVAIAVSKRQRPKPRPEIADPCPKTVLTPEKD